MPHLSLTIAIDGDRLRVTQEWEGLTLEASEVLGQIRESVAGASCIDLNTTQFEAHDDDGPLPLSVETSAGDGVPLRGWAVERRTQGQVVLDYYAEATTEWPSSPNAPLELRREGDGFTGALKCFLVLPPTLEAASFDLAWQPGAVVGARRNEPTFASSLGEAADALTGADVNELAHSYLICSTTALPHHTAGSVSAWWLTPPVFDVPTFVEQLGETYEAMAATFDAESHPYRVFLRASPYRGMNASAHPASFVIAMDPSTAPEARTLERTVTHELVHEWLHLDGPAGDTTWFNEGAADYYALTVARRRGVIDDDIFLAEVNTAARLGYANPFHDLTLDEAASQFWSDFRAHRLPYARGMFYLADLDARLRDADPGHGSRYGSRYGLDDLVRDVLRRQRAGEAVGLVEWCALVDSKLEGDERDAVQRMVFEPGGRPGRKTFSPGFTLTQIEAPIIEPGFHVDSFPAGRIIGLVAGGPADRAGLLEGESVELPTYETATHLEAGAPLIVTVDRDGRSTPVAVSASERTVVIPQWQR